MTDLSKRLLTVARAVSPGRRVADIGTDHGYVPIWLVERGIIPSAIAMDINKGPLERASAHIRESGLQDRIETRLSDGLDALARDEADTLVIAGMGGDLMCRILREGKDLLSAGPELILQPQSEWFKVRYALHELGYRIEREWFLKEDGKYYVILRSIPGEQRFQSETEYIYGAYLEEECSPVLEEYLVREKKKRKRILEQIRGNSGHDSGSREERAAELECEICRIEERLSMLAGGIVGTIPMGITEEKRAGR